MAIAKRTDADIQLDVLEEFDWDPQVESTEIGVEVDDGIVTLTGTVDFYGKKLAAKKAALRVTGVRAVADNLSIHGAGDMPNDTDIAKAAAAALDANGIVPRKGISITVNNGKITLDGTVNWEYQRKAAEKSLRHLEGVRAVLNNIVLQQPKVSEAEIESGIERALLRSAEIDANRIRVHIEGGHVRLTGTVSSWSERQAAGAAAWRAKGVTGVINELVIQPI